MLKPVILLLLSSIIRAHDPQQGVNYLSAYPPIYPLEEPCYCETVLRLTRLHKSFSDLLDSSDNLTGFKELWKRDNSSVEQSAVMEAETGFTAFVAVGDGGNMTEMDMTGHFRKGGMFVADFDFGTTRLRMANQKDIYVHKDFYCFLSIEQGPHRYLHDNAADKIKSDVHIILPDLVVNNGVVHIIDRPIQFEKQEETIQPTS